MLIGVVSLPNDRQFVHVDPTALKLSHCLIRFRMRAVHGDN
jgi:acyl dehydratase